MIHLSQISPTAGAEGVCVLDAPLTVQHVAGLHASLRDALADGAHTLDLAASTDCDSAGAQLLMSAARSLPPGQSALTLCNVPPAVLEVLTRYALVDRTAPLAGDAA
jgi:ABC-type transporter Mla MlaB component